MNKLLGGANFLKYQIVVYFKTITASTMDRGHLFLFNYLGYNFFDSRCVKRGILAYLSVLILGLLILALTLLICKTYDVGYLLSDLMVI